MAALGAIVLLARFSKASERYSLMDWHELDAWLADLDLPFPLTAEQHVAHAAYIAAWCEAHPACSGGPIEALLWIRIGHLHPAHNLVQHATRGLEAYLHGVVHRIEGDYWNAKYWFRQVQSPSLLQRIEAEIGDMLANAQDKAFYASPSAFVDACESASKQAPREALRRYAQREWDALWRVASERDGMANSGHTT
jgi:hypothetical protein